MLDRVVELVNSGRVLPLRRFVAQEQENPIAAAACSAQGRSRTGDKISRG